MKKHNIFNIALPVLLFLVGVFTGCSKDDGPIKKDVLKDIDAVPAINTTVDPTGSQAIDMLNLGAFQGKFSVTMYFTDAKPPEKVDVVVRKTNSGGTTVKVFKAGVSTLPVSYSITRADLEGLFGAITLGDNYDFGVDIYANGGKKYEAFPVGGIGTASGPNGMPGYSQYARFGAICAYDPSIYQGDFLVVSDDFAEYAVGQVVTLTQVSSSKFSFQYESGGIVGPLAPVVVSVNTGNNNLSIIPSVNAALFYGYHNLVVKTDASGSFVSPCDQLVTLSLNYNVDEGSFGGGFKLILKKKP